MLSKISLLTSLVFCAIYPLIFLIHRRDPIRHKFHQFHLGLPTVILGATMPFVWMMAPAPGLKLVAVAWLIVLLGLTGYYWKRDYPNAFLMYVPFALGIFVFQVFQVSFAGATGPYESFMGILSGMVFTFSMYAMNLGHFYLNVHGLTIEHLVRATYLFWIVTGIRLAVDVYQILFAKVLYAGEIISLMSFVSRLDGFLLLTGIFFGTIFPFFALFLVKETLKLKNTQSSTGILYVILCGVLLGHIVYQYYFLKFGIYL